MASDQRDKDLIEHEAKIALAKQEKDQQFEQVKSQKEKMKKDLTTQMMNDRQAADLKKQLRQ